MGCWRALAAYAAGAVELAGGDPATALIAFAAAARAWQQLQAPYEAARAPSTAGARVPRVGDDDRPVRARGRARGVFAGSARPGPRVRRAPRAAAGRDAHGLTVARAGASPRRDGKSNREIAAALVLSEHTFARHLQNIFARLGVPSRTAARRSRSSTTSSSQK